jgi:hypothetical protein
MGYPSTHVQRVWENKNTGGRNIDNIKYNHWNNENVFDLQDCNNAERWGMAQFNIVLNKRF